MQLVTIPMKGCMKSYLFQELPEACWQNSNQIKEECHLTLSTC